MRLLRTVPGSEIAHELPNGIDTCSACGNIEVSNRAETICSRALTAEEKLVRPAAHIVRRVRHHGLAPQGRLSRRGSRTVLPGGKQRSRSCADPCRKARVQPLP